MAREEKKGEKSFVEYTAKDIFLRYDEKLFGCYRAQTTFLHSPVNHESLLKELKPFSGLMKGGNILDIGCGDGQFLISFVLEFTDLIDLNKAIGIDISKKSLLKAITIKRDIFDKEDIDFDNSDDETDWKLHNVPLSLLHKRNKIKDCFRKEFVDGINESHYLNKFQLNKMSSKILFKLRNVLNYKEDYGFDVIFCISVAEFIYSLFDKYGLYRLYDQIRRLLNHKGVLFINENSRSSYKYKIKGLWI